MENNETIADIIADMRKIADNPECVAPTGLRFTADRLEAAWKREKSAIEADALAVGGIVEASRATAEKSSTVGDAAKMREALKSCVDEMCDRCRELAAARGNPLPCLSGCEPVRKAKAALAAPPRNCDLARDWLQDLYCKFKPPASVRREMPPEWVDAVMAFCKWLVAQAKDAKGENNANK